MANSFWWLSFVDSKLPKGKQFLGVVIVVASGPTEAVVRSHQLKVNPGGEVSWAPLPSWVCVDARWLGRLLTTQECDEVASEFEKKRQRMTN